MYTPAPMMFMVPPSARGRDFLAAAIGVRDRTPIVPQCAYVAAILVEDFIRWVGGVSIQVDMSGSGCVAWNVHGG